MIKLENKILLIDFIKEKKSYELYSRIKESLNSDKKESVIEQIYHLSSNTITVFLKEEFEEQKIEFELLELLTFIYEKQKSIINNNNLFS